MRRTKIVFIGSAVLVALFSTGCGSITAGTVVQKAGMWVAKEAVKKGYQKFKEDRDRGRGGDETSEDRNQSGRSHPRRERRHED